MKIICNDCGKNIIFKHEKTIYLSYDRKIAENKGFNNLEKLTDDELINIGYIRLYINSLTNNDASYLTESDYKFGYREMISEGTDIECKKCYTKHENCFKCNKYHKSGEMNKYYCLNCYNTIKNEKPTNNNNICKFDEDKLIWYIDYKKCKSCDEKIYKKNNDNKHPNLMYHYLSQYLETLTKRLSRSFKTKCDKCYEKDIYNETINLFKNDGYEVKIKNFEILLKKKCNCGNEMPWTSSCNLYNKYRQSQFGENPDDIYRYQCKDCNPSNDKIKYIYIDDLGMWHAYKKIFNCLNCNREKEYPYHFPTQHYYGYLLKLCENCLPNKKFVQYKKITMDNINDLLPCLSVEYCNFENDFKNLYILYKIKKFREYSDGKIRHYWDGELLDLNENYSHYKCGCLKCLL